MSASRAQSKTEMWVSLFVASCHTQNVVNYRMCRGTWGRRKEWRGNLSSLGNKCSLMPTAICPKNFHDSVSLTVYTRNINRNDNFYLTPGKIKNRVKCQVSLCKDFQKANTGWNCRIITGLQGHVTTTLTQSGKSPSKSHWQESMQVVFLPLHLLPLGKHLRIVECQRQSCPGRCGSVDWVLAYEPKGHQLHSQAGHLPGLWARSH